MVSLTTSFVILTVPVSLRVWPGVGSVEAALPAYDRARSGQPKLLPDRIYSRPHHLRTFASSHSPQRIK